MNTEGAERPSAPADALLLYFGFTAERAVAAAKAVLERARSREEPRADAALRRHGAEVDG